MRVLTVVDVYKHLFCPFNSSTTKMKEPIVLKADVPLDSNTTRSELLWIIAPEILGLY